MSRKNRGRQVNQAQSESGVAMAEEMDDVESVGSDDARDSATPKEKLNGTSKYNYLNEMLPVLPFDFDILTINQQFIILDTEELKLFHSEHKLSEGDKVWISDGERMILSSIMTRDDEPTLTIHWGVRQRVIVCGDAKEDFDEA